jgi:hypothetical protein
MECEHIWIEKEIPTPQGGYMVLKFCHVCRDAQGYGFLNKEHEVNYLNTLLNLDSESAEI